MEEAERLVTAARDGDRAAFDELVRQTYHETYTLAFRLTGNEEDARDVVQETYLRAWRGLRRFRGDAQFSTWLYRITANASYSLLERRKRTRTEPLGDQLLEQPDTGAAGDPQGSVEADDLRERVATAVQALPPKLRAVVVLKDVYGLSHEEIADELGISESAAKVRLHRARLRLRDELFDDRRRRAHAV